MKRVLPLLLLVGCADHEAGDSMSAKPYQPKTAHLAWTYTDQQVAQADVVGFRVYEGVLERCLEPRILEDEVGIAPASERGFVRHGVPVAKGIVCYELTAYSEARESAHSQRASTRAERLH